jgi:hypothetical protein
MITAAIGATAAMKAATTTASVRTAAASTAVASATTMLGKSGGWDTSQGDRSDRGKKSVEKGGFPHVSNLHHPVGCPGGLTQLSSYLHLDSGSSSKVARLGGNGLASIAENGRSPNDPLRTDAFPI